MVVMKGLTLEIQDAESGNTYRGFWSDPLHYAVRTYGDSREPDFFYGSPTTLFCYDMGSEFATRMVCPEAAGL
jgi:hypothetical protein